MYLPKGILFLIFFGILQTSCILQKGTSYPSSLVLVDKKKKIYLDYRPISNLDWREYMFYQKNKFGEQADEYLKTWPDTVAWKIKYPEESFDRMLIQYANAPIVGITHRQASEYCTWRTEVVNQKFALKFQFELPSADVFISVLEKKKFKTVSDLPFVRKPPSNTFYNLCGSTPEYTNDSSKILTKSNHLGQCVFRQPERTEYTHTGFRCVARRMTK